VTSSATITVNSASSQTAFYVDPTYTGSTQNGSASAPWKSLLDSDSDYTAKWSTITTALASTDVMWQHVYRMGRRQPAGLHYHPRL